MTKSRKFAIDHAEWDAPPTMEFRCRRASDNSLIRGVYENAKSHLSGALKSIVKIGRKRYLVETSDEFRGLRGIHGTMKPL